MSKTKLLDKKLKQENLDGFLIKDNSTNPDLYYLTEFDVSDPFIYLRTNQKNIILTSSLEKTRAKKESTADQVLTPSDLEQEDKINALLEKYQVEKLAVPQDFPIALANKIEQNQKEVKPIENKIMESRKIKTQKEIENLRKVQQMTEKAMKKAKKLLKESEVQENKLFLNNTVLTSQKLKKEIKHFLIDQNCEVPTEMIISCGKESAEPHERGKGPLKPNKPIVIDMVPQHQTKYHGDMTRTFVKGKPKPELKEMKDAVEKALEEAFKILEEGEGVKAQKIHYKVCDVLEKHGYNTVKNEMPENGFIHATGHGIGLEPHEPPKIASNEDKLKEGMILTIEPGLYLSDIGGVRLEDMVLIKEKGYENFNKMENQMKV